MKNKLDNRIKLLITIFYLEISSIEKYDELAYDLLIAPVGRLAW
tara:strand:- start:688 stop:819 length:132 start_codon:yes stop_codon:yes gene_type:complete